MKTVADGRARRGRALSLGTSEAIRGFLFVLPALVLLGIFVYRPLLETVRLSFYDWNMVSPTQTYVGWRNYAELWQSPGVRRAVVNTGTYALWLGALVLVLPTIATIALTYMRSFWRRLFRVVLFLPNIISLATASVIWLWIYNPIGGFLAAVWAALDKFPVNWLSNPRTALGAVAVIVAWKAFGYNFLLLTAGLAGVPQEVVEAARVDGAEGWVLWRHILIPMLGPTIVFVLSATLVMAAEYVFTPVHMLTEGGPINASTNVVFEIWRQAFRWFRVGYSSAIAVCVFLLFLVITTVQMLVSERVVSYEER